MFETPCSVSADELAHDAGEGRRCAFDAALSSSRDEYIAEATLRLFTTARLECFLAPEDGQERVLGAIADALTLESLGAAREQFYEFLRSGARLLANQQWLHHESVAAFRIMDDMREQHGWWAAQ